MKVRMLVSIAGTVDGVRYPPQGAEFEVADVVGANLCAKGQAEPVAAPPKRETRKGDKD